MVTAAERLSQLYSLERQGVLSNVMIYAPGDGAKRFTFTVVSDGNERSLRAGELDPFLAGVQIGLAAARPEQPSPEPEPAPARTTVKATAK